MQESLIKYIENKNMKKSVFIAVLCFLTIGATAQIETPVPSPAASLTQKVGLTDITVDYSRPSMRDRDIFGNLVPYNAIWRTGANSNTVINFSTNVTIGGTEVKAGAYAIFTKPTCLLYTSPSPRDKRQSRMPSSA